MNRSSFAKLSNSLRLQRAIKLVWQSAPGWTVAQFALTGLRREIGVIFQDYAQYHLSARENIWLDDVRLPSHDARIIGAAHASGADHVIARLPKGYDTLLGKWFDKGEELSIGEWQKIARARFCATRNSSYSTNRRARSTRKSSTNWSSNSASWCADVPLC